MAPTRDLSRSRAILIGSATFDHPRIPNLPQARACVDAVGELLTGGLCGWPAGRVARLVDVSDPPQLAVQVRDLLRDVDDVLLVYYVGHGIRTSEGQLALALRETDPDPEVLAHTGMLYESLAKILRGCRARTKLVILDCCHAELGHKANYVFQSADLAEAYPVDGLYFIGASARDTKAKAPAGGELTYFTQAFLDVIRAGIPISDPMLSLDRIFKELRKRLAEARLPIPVEAGTRGAHQFPFARNIAAVESAQAAPERPVFAWSASRRERLVSVLAGLLGFPVKSPRKRRHALVVRGVVLAVVIASATIIATRSLSDPSGMARLWSIDADSSSGGQNGYIGTWTSGDLVAVGFADSITGYSLDAGKTLWTWTPPDGQKLCEMSSAVDNGIGMIAYESGAQVKATSGYNICQKMTAINLADGRDAWAIPVSLAPAGSPNTGAGEGIAIDGSVAAVLEGDDNIHGYSLAAGRQLWSSASTWAACGGRQQNFNYSNMAESGSTVYVDYACTAHGVNYKNFILGFSMGTGAPSMNLTLTGPCKTAAVSGLWAFSKYLIADCGNETAQPADSFEVINAATAQLAETLPTDSVDTLQSLENQTGQIVSQRFTVSGSTLYAEGSGSTGGNIVLALDLDTGRTMWSKPVSNAVELSLIGSNDSGAVAVLSQATPGRTPEIAMSTYAEADGTERAGSSLADSSVTASSGDTFLEDGDKLIDVNGSAAASTPFITVYSSAYAD